MKSLSLFFSVFLCLTAHSQVLPYTLTVFNEPYVDLVGSTNLTEGELWDDPELLVPIGFNFDLMGQNMTELGILYPGAQCIPVVAGNIVNVLLPYMSDIIDAGIIDDTPASPISYRIEGEVGSRIFKIEWKNVGFYEEFAQNGTVANTTNFQMWLYETTNDLEFRYGNNTIKNPELVHFSQRPVVGIGRNIALDGSSFEVVWLLDGDPLNPEIFAYTNPKADPTAENLLDAEPPTGTVYHFDTGIVGMTERQIENQMVVFPTLADEIITVLWGGEFPANLEIFNASGELVTSEIVNSKTEEINVKSLESGLYVVVLNDGTNTRTSKLIKR